MSITRTLLEFLDVPAAASWDMEPEEALAFLKAKGLSPSFDYRDLIGREHARAFTVAKMMDTDLLADVKDSLDDALAKGVPFREWADTITPMLQAKGWWGRKAVTDPLTGETIVAALGSPSRLQTIYRTNMQSAYAAGAWDAIVDQAELAPFLLYDAVDDHRTRPDHAAWDGTVLEVTDDWWSTHYPPNGWNCRCSVIQLSGEDLADLGLVPNAKAPAIDTVPWVNPRTGRTRQVPKGVDPGWDFNVGAERAKALAQTVADKLKGYPPGLSQAAAAGMAAAQEAGAAAFAADVAAGQLALAKEMGKLASARGAMKAAERSAAWQLEDALASKTPYLAKSIKDLQKTKAGQAMGPAELLAAAKAQADKLQQQTALSDWKKAYLADKAAPVKAQAAFDALPDDAAQALKAQLDATKAAAAAETAAQGEFQAMLAKSSGSLEAKAASKALQDAGEGAKFAQLLATAQADVAAAKAKQVAGQVKAGLKKALIEGKQLTPAQMAASTTMTPDELAALLKEVDDAKTAALAKSATELPPASAPPGAVPVTAPGTLNPDKLVQIGPQKGSNPGGLYRDTDTGETWYIKTPPSADHARNEVLAGKLYQAAGVQVPELRLTTLNGQPAVASRIVDGLTKTDGDGLAMVDGVKEGFVVDAWLANWDVVGATYDNLLVKGWSAFRVDTGGALLFRAQGATKGSAFGDTVTELKTFLDASKNPNTAKAFAGITSEQLQAGAARVLAISDDTIRALVAQHGPGGELGEVLAKRLIARKAHLAKEFTQASAAFTKAKAQAIEAAQFAATEGLAQIDAAMLTAIKGIAKRASEGGMLEAKDLERVSAAQGALSAWLKEHIPVLGVDAVNDVRGFYLAWLDTLEAATGPGVGKPAKWAGEKFVGYKGALAIDASKVKVTLPPEGMKFTQASAKATITKALGPSAASMNVPDNGGAAALKAALPLEHQRAVAAYTGSHYRTVNEVLRAGTASPAQLAYADLVNEALTLAPKYTGEVARGISLEGKALDKFLADHRQAMVTGQGVVHRGFISTTKGSSAAFGGNIVLHIESKTGVWVRPISLHAGENEVLLPHGSLFAVKDVKQTGGRYHVYLEELPQ